MNLIMETKRIIIISAQEQMRSFFRLEALNFDFCVECFDKFEKKHSDLSGYDLAIIDRDTVKQSPLNTAKKEITVSTCGGDADIEYPMPIADLKKIYNDLCSAEPITKSKSEAQDNKIIFYNNEKNIVSVGQRKYILSDTEYKILTLLCRNSQRLVLREEIQELFENERSNIGDVYICKLRKKLESPSGQRLIFTVREKGYKIIAEAEWR